jgi:hypothetical protein
MPLPSVGIVTRPVKGPFSHYLGAHECAMLVHLIGAASPRVMVEFGVNIGRTARRVLDNVPSIKTYIGIDVPYGYRPVLRCQDSEVPWHMGSEAMACRDRFWTLECMHGAERLKPGDLEPIDAAFIDGCHSDSGVTHDSRLARALLNPAGIIVWHDYGNRAVEVTQALDRLYDDGWPIKHVTGTWLAYMRNDDDGDR